MSQPSHPSYRKRIRRVLVLLSVAAVLGLAASSALFVEETECVIVERFGAISAVYDQPEHRGLQFKLPWPLEISRRFDRRVQLLNLPAREIFTRDKKNVVLDTYVCWKIADAEPKGVQSLEQRPVVRFFRSLGDQEIAAARLESRVRSVLTARFGQVEFDRLLHVPDSESGPSSDAPGLLQQLAEEIRDEVQAQAADADSLSERLGIEVVEVGFQRVNFPEGNRTAVHERMRSERRKIADRYRNEGLAESKLIRSQAELWAVTLLARARADAERIRGEAEAEAARILNAAHLQDPEFYQILRTLDGYRRIITPNTTLVLSASSRLLKLLTEGLPEPAANEPSVSP